MGAALVLLVAVLLPATPAAAETVRQGQWHLDALKVSAAQAITRGDGVVVAVIDTGVEGSHPDLAGQLLTGVDLAGGSGAQVDTDGHGTAMAGLIVAKGGGVNHALGIAPGAKVLPIRVGNSGSIEGNAVADGIRYATDHGAKVINISLAREGTPTDYERSAVAYALSKDVVVVVGAGNIPDGYLTIGGFAQIPGVLVVGAVDRNGGSWSGSTTGPEVGISAPGVDIVSTGSRGAGHQSGYVIGNGTSNSTAIVSAAAALIRARYPDLHMPDVINRLIRTADDAGAPGRDPQYGFGRLDLVGALTANVPHTATNPLGGATSATTRPGTGTGTGGDDTATGNAPSGRALLGIGIFLCVLLGLIALVVVLIVTSLGRRRRRAAAQAAAYPPAYGQPGYPPTGYPPTAYPPTGQYPTPGQYPAAPAPYQAQPGTYGAPGYPTPGYPAPAPPPAGQPPQPGQPSYDQPPYDQRPPSQP